MKKEAIKALRESVARTKTIVALMQFDPAFLNSSIRDVEDELEAAAAAVMARHCDSYRTPVAYLCDGDVIVNYPVNQTPTAEWKKLLKP